MDGETERRYLTSHEVAAVLGVSNATMRVWRRLGEGPPAVRAGRRLWRYEEHQLYEWMDQQQQVST